MRNRSQECRVSVPGLTQEERQAIKKIKKAGKYKNYSEFIKHLIEKHDTAAIRIDN